MIIFKILSGINGEPSKADKGDIEALETRYLVDHFWVSCDLTFDFCDAFVWRNGLSGGLGLPLSLPFFRSDFSAPAEPQKKPIQKIDQPNAILKTTLR